MGTNTKEKGEGKKQKENQTEKGLLEILRLGKIELVGQFIWGSNHTLLAKVQHRSGDVEAIYKPQRGERPLWDFPDETLAGREVAAYLVSEALGWEMVPPTVYRQDGPYGPGSLQLRVDHDPGLHYFIFDQPTRQQLRPVALFDLIVNNADRKGGHILLDREAKIWLIDHGICFHTEPKLRTVVWDFVGESIPAELLASVSSLKNQLRVETKLGSELGLYLSDEELLALEERLKAVLTEPRFPKIPVNERVTPWPLV
ncbi:MAG: SCO1664 family protein [Anaerolineales bacterium]